MQEECHDGQSTDKSAAQPARRFERAKTGFHAALSAAAESVSGRFASAVRCARNLSGRVRRLARKIVRSVLASAAAITEALHFAAYHFIGITLSASAIWLSASFLGDFENASLEEGAKLLAFFGGWIAYQKFANVNKQEEWFFVNKKILPPEHFSSEELARAVLYVCPDKNNG